jgi:hypothetical protein
MRYRPVQEVIGKPHVMTDGPGVAGSVMVLSHWPDSCTPWPLKADLSAEIAFNYLDQPEYHVDAEWVTNTHLDIDGLVSVFVLHAPEEALARRQPLVEVAAAGDFQTGCSDRMARAAFVVGSLTSKKASVFPAETFVGEKADVVGRLYDRLLAMLAEIVDDVDRFEPLWAEEQASLDAAEDAIKRGDVRIEERGDNLAVVWLSPEWRDPGVHRSALQEGTPVHPMAIHRRTDADAVAYLDLGSNVYRLVYRFESWVQRISRPAGRVDLRPLAARLDDLDGSPGWIAAGRKTFIGWLRRRDGAPSAIAPDVFANTVHDHLRSTAMSWDPYDPQP